MNAVFKEYNEIIQYIKDNSDTCDRIESNQTIMLRNCIFESTIEFQWLLCNLKSNWKNLAGIDFTASVFKGAVYLNQAQPKEKKDENGKTINIEYFNAWNFRCFTRHR